MAPVCRTEAGPRRCRTPRGLLPSPLEATRVWRMMGWWLSRDGRQFNRCSTRVARRSAASTAASSRAVAMRASRSAARWTSPQRAETGGHASVREERRTACGAGPAAIRSQSESCVSLPGPGTVRTRDGKRASPPPRERDRWSRRPVGASRRRGAGPMKRDTPLIGRRRIPRATSRSCVKDHRGTRGVDAPTDPWWQPHETGHREAGRSAG